MLEVIITIWGTNYTKQLLPVCKQIKSFVKDTIKDEEWSTTQNTILSIKYYLSENSESIDSINNKKRSVIDINILDLDLNVIQKKRSNSGERKTSTILKFNAVEKHEKSKSPGKRLIRNRSIDMESNNIKETDVVKGPKVVEYESVSSQFYFDKEMGRYFCESFFIAGLPEKDAKLINNSESFIPICGHSECAILPSFRPQVLYRLPFKDTKAFELNNSVNCY
jgi:hypothetical protein